MPPKYKMEPMALIFFILFVTLMLLDLGFVVFGGVGASLSSWIAGRTAVAKGLPPLSVFLFCFGVVCGHLFFNLREEK